MVIFVITPMAMPLSTSSNSVNVGKYVNVLSIYDNYHMYINQISDRCMLIDIPIN